MTNASSSASARKVEAARLRLCGKPARKALELDPIIHDRVRLAMLAALSVGGEMSFTDLREACRATDGNVASHSKRLEEAGYLTIVKRKRSKRPKTALRITARGKRALARYLDHMRAVADSVAPGR